MSMGVSFLGTSIACLIPSCSSLQDEIEKVKKRREERALEKAQHEEEMVREASWHLVYRMSLP